MRPKNESAERLRRVVEIWAAISTTQRNLLYTHAAGLFIAGYGLRVWRRLPEPVSHAFLTTAIMFGALLIFPPPPGTTMRGLVAVWLGAYSFSLAIVLFALHHKPNSKGSHWVR